MDPALKLYRIGAKTILRPGIAYVADHLPRNGLIINICFCGNFTADTAKIGRHQRFTGHPGIRILRQACIQNAVGDSVRHFIRMACGDALRCKQSFFHAIDSFLDDVILF